MRIVHYIKWLRLRDGGTVRAVLDLSGGLAARGHEVVLLSCDDSGVPPAWRSGGAGVPRSALLRLADPLWEWRGRKMADATRDTVTQYLPKDAMKVARELIGGADVLHLHGVWANSNHQLARLAASLGVPHVVSPHGMLDDWSMAQGAMKKKVHLALMSRRTLERAHAVHCTAQAELEQARRHFPAGRGVAIPLLFDIDQFGALPGPDLASGAFGAISTEHPNVLFLSRVHAKKGVDLLIRAAASAKKLGAPFNLLIAGPPDPAEYLGTLKDLVRDLRMQEHVHFLGMVTGREKISLYQAADVFALPTSQENFGYVLYEALACGTPVVTTRGVDIWPELEASGGAKIVGREERLIRGAIRELLDDPIKRREMGEAGRAWALTHLDPEATLEAFEKMYSRPADRLGL